jgi:hypothetical protein
MEHFLTFHQNAFAAFGGVPGKVMVDNLKSAVLQRLVGVAPVLNPRYVDFARHYGFEIAPCNVRRGNEKGRVESGVGYVKKNFLSGLELADFTAIQAAGRQWLDTIANVRIHNETRQRPIDLLVQERPQRQLTIVLRSAGNTERPEDGRRPDPALGQVAWRGGSTFHLPTFSRTPADSADSA